MIEVRRIGDDGTLDFEVVGRDGEGATASPHDNVAGKCVTGLCRQASPPTSRGIV